MTSRDLILGLISGAPQTNAMLAGALMGSGFPPERAYSEVHDVTRNLAAELRIMRHDYAGCWMIGQGAKMEPREDAPAERKAKPSGYGNATAAERLVPKVEQ